MHPQPQVGSAEANVGGGWSDSCDVSVIAKLKSRKTRCGRSRKLYELDHRTNQFSVVLALERSDKRILEKREMAVHLIKEKEKCLA